MSSRPAVRIALLGCLPVAVLALVLGNPFVARAISDRVFVVDDEGVVDTGPAYLLLFFLHPGGGGESVWPVELIVFVVGYVITLGGLFGLLYLGARAVHRAHGGAAMLLIGWGALTVSSAVGGTPGGVVRAIADDPALWSSGLGLGSTYGLVMGWAAGLVAMLVYRKLRTAGAGGAAGPAPRPQPAGGPGGPGGWPGGPPPPAGPPPGQYPPGQQSPGQGQPGQGPGQHPQGQWPPGRGQPGRHPPGQQPPGAPPPVQPQHPQQPPGPHGPSSVE